jgi:hypothetical protein
VKGSNGSKASLVVQALVSAGEPEAPRAEESR